MTTDGTHLLHELRSGAEEKTTNGLGAGLGAAAKQVSPADGIIPFVLDAEDDLLLVGDNVRVFD